MVLDIQPDEADAILNHKAASDTESGPSSGLWRVEIMSRAEIERLPRWPSAFSRERKDRRYYEIVEDTIDQGFDYRYFVVRGDNGEVQAIQPFFINDQDLVAGAGAGVRKIVSFIRKAWPRFLRMRTLMVGCAAGEGHLDAEDEPSRSHLAASLARGIPERARELKTGLIVFKEFTIVDRPALSCLPAHGFARIPSMPMTRLRLNFANFEDYLRNGLSRNMRSKLRRKYKASESFGQLEMRVVTDVSPYIHDVYPLYHAVFERAELRFEKLTPEYFCKIGQKMPDKARFFLWFYQGMIVCFNFCLISDKSICSEYIGFDYDVAFDLHLYYIAIRDVMTWAIENGYEWYCSTALNYEPKFHLRHELYPLDLYVRHTSPIVNFFLKRAIVFLEPTRNDEILRRFSNFADLHASA
jgi:hypothetical protein